jgi:hypothetical protein
MKWAQWSGVLAVAALLLAVGCEESTSPEEPTPVSPPAPPSNLQALSVDDSTVRLKWSPSPSESNSRFGGYELRVYNDANGSFVGKTRLQRSPTDITGLRSGTVYRFELYATWADTTRDTARSRTAAVVRWSPATRYTTFADGSPIRLYETDSRFPSGLDLEGPDGRPRALTVRDGNEWDLCLDTRGGSYDIGSPRLSTYNITNPRRTLIDTLRLKDPKYLAVDSLNQVFETEAFGATTLAEALAELQQPASGLSHHPAYAGRQLGEGLREGGCPGEHPARVGARPLRGAGDLLPEDAERALCTASTAREALGGSDDSDSDRAQAGGGVAPLEPVQMPRFPDRGRGFLRRKVLADAVFLRALECVG